MNQPVSPNLNPSIEISGISMTPLICSGDDLILSMTKDHSAPGDIIVFKQNHEWVAHRILEKSPSLLTKGDRALSNDEPITDFYSKVIGIKRKDKIYHWGDEGHLFKSLFVFLSKLSEAKNPKFIRLSALIIQRLFAPLIELYSLAKARRKQLR